MSISFIIHVSELILQEIRRVCKRLITYENIVFTYELKL
jgi:hypothetical protein